MLTPIPLRLHRIRVKANFFLNVFIRLYTFVHSQRQKMLPVFALPAAHQPRAVALLNGEEARSEKFVKGFSLVRRNPVLTTSKDHG